MGGVTLALGADAAAESRLSRTPRGRETVAAELEELCAAHEFILTEARALAREAAEAAKAADDALHVAVAAHAEPYLLTWNCAHLANATMRPVIESVCASKGFKAPIICTPEELSGDPP